MLTGGYTVERVGGLFLFSKHLVRRVDQRERGLAVHITYLSGYTGDGWVSLY